jgi:DNA-directed RNA polymerase sigma subunit (sigma70/sigma32)
MFTLKANNWISTATSQTLEKVEKNFNTLHEAIRHAESKGYNAFKVYTHQSQLVHWFRHEKEPVRDFS